MLLITNHLKTILDLLTEIKEQIQKIEKNQDHSQHTVEDQDLTRQVVVKISKPEIAFLKKKMKKLDILINGDNVNKDVITRFGAFSFFHGVSRPLDPPFVRLVRSFKKGF